MIKRNWLLGLFLGVAIAILLDLLFVLSITIKCIEPLSCSDKLQSFLGALTFFIPAGAVVGIFFGLIFEKKFYLALVILLIGIAGLYLGFMREPSISDTSQTNETLSNYHSKELRLSFKYFSDLKVYQQDENNVLIKADYKNPEHSLVSIEMGIRRINAQRETDDQINFRLQGKKIIKEENRDGYRILQFEGGSQYYILSDMGTFYVGDTLDTFSWKDIFQKEGLYQPYRLKFDTVRNSIVFD